VYRDRRGRACAASFCPDHWILVGGIVYCRRHAGVITAIGKAADSPALPQVEDRGPSLVSWVADQISPGVEALLRAAARPGESVKTETELIVVFDSKRRRRWQRSWKLFESTGVTVKVCLQVAEDEDDALIDVRVGSIIVARGIPPWIARRRAGLEVTGQVDAAQRELFSVFFIDHIAEELARDRAADAPLAV
jgi:hypothetical protein